MSPAHKGSSRMPTWFEMTCPDDQGLVCLAVRFLEMYLQPTVPTESDSPFLSFLDPVYLVSQPFSGKSPYRSAPKPLGSFPVLADRAGAFHLPQAILEGWKQFSTPPPGTRWISHLFPPSLGSCKVCGRMAVTEITVEIPKSNSC